MKKITVLLLLFSVVSLMIYSKFHYEIREFMNPNSLYVTTDENLDISKVKIKWDSPLATPTIIFDRGICMYMKFKEYGKNKFYVYYDNELVENFGHFKVNNWHGNEYYVNLFYENETICVDSKIIGPDSNSYFEK